MFVPSVLIILLHTHEKNKQSKTLGEALPEHLRLHKRLSGWVSIAQQYANTMNKVLTTSIDSRSAKFQEMMKTINPPKTVAEVIKLSDYLDGTLIP